MEIIKIDLSNELKNIELHTFADEHIGDKLCDISRLKERIKYIKDTPNAYCVLNGDIIDNATRASIGDIYSSSIPPMKQLETATDLFGCIKNKILAITNGNHEMRTYYKDGIDISKLISQQLGIADKYSSTSALIFLRFGKKIASHRQNEKTRYCIYMLHGSGGGRKEGAKAIRLADMASIVDADIYIHSHTHLPMVMKQAFHRVCFGNNSVEVVEKLFINTAANLNYGGYGEMAEFKPSSKQSPVIYLNGSKREMSAKL